MVMANAETTTTCLRAKIERRQQGGTLRSAALILIPSLDVQAFAVTLGSAWQGTPISDCSLRYVAEPQAQTIPYFNTKFNSFKIGISIS